MSAVVVAARLQRRRETDAWKLNQRVESAIDLKAAVGEIRSTLSKVARDGGRGVTIDWNFAKVNVAMTRGEMTGPDDIAGVVANLRSSLREFIRSATAPAGDWKLARDRLDEHLDVVATE